MQALKALGGLFGFIVAVLAGAFVISLLVFGMTLVATTMIPYLAIGTTFALPICGMVLLPLTAFRATRVFAVFAIYGCSYLFGAFLWCIGFVVTMQFWGWFGVVIGLFFLGIGVVPVGILAAAFHGEWSIVGNLLVGAVVVYGARFFAIHKANKIDEEDEQMLSAYAD